MILLVKVMIIETSIKKSKRENYNSSNIKNKTKQKKIVSSHLYIKGF